MDISLLHAGLAAGAALAALPVILHLFMKQKPKRIIFPALRLIRERQKRAKKQLKIKNWLLLAARMLLLALMALALAQPTLNSESSLGMGEVSTAVALVFDTSMSMEYTERGKDRLAEAKLRAGEILKRSTDDSEIYVFDSAVPVKPEHSLTPAAALKRIDGLTLKAANHPLNTVLIQASQVVAASKLPRREVYVLTDLTASAWELTSSRTTEELKKLREGKTKVATYILQLTPKEVRNAAIMDVDLSTITPTDGEPVEIQVTIRATGPEKTHRVAEFYLDGDKKRGQKSVELPANGEQVVSFTTSAKLDPGVHQGMIKLGGQADSMAFDDIRYFTFTSQPATRVLVVASPENDGVDGKFVANALAPYKPGGDEASPALGGADPAAPPSTYRVDRQTPEQFIQRDGASLKGYVAVFLLNLKGLPPAGWGKLRAYVSEGGGVVVAPGERADPSNYNGPAATALLPGQLGGQPTDKDTTFGKAAYNHPLFSRFASLIDPVLTATPIYHHWPVKADPKAATLLSYTDGSPALLERIFPGQRPGRVLLWTTPLARQVARNVPGAWNEFPRTWAFLSLILETIPYLAGTAGERFNYEAGQDAILTIDPTHRAPNYVVQGPDPKVTDRLAASAQTDTLVIAAPQKEGQYRVEGQAADGYKSRMGFSLNAPSTESQLVALKPENLTGLFGAKDKFQVADDPASLERAQSKGRYGIELFPYVMFLILGLVTAENLLANKFHRDSAAA